MAVLLATEMALNSKVVLHLLLSFVITLFLETPTSIAIEILDLRNLGSWEFGILEIKDVRNLGFLDQGSLGYWELRILEI